MDDHVCCNLDKIQQLEKVNEVYKKCLEQINDYIKQLDTEDKRKINNIIINSIN